MGEISAGLLGLGFGIYLLTSSLEEYTVAGLVGINILLGSGVSMLLGLERLGLA